MIWTKHVNKRCRIIVLLLAILSLTGIFLYRWVEDYNEWNQKAMDSVMAMEWSGFGPERGLYNFTVVTAMIDIGRGEWQSQSRSYSTYLLYMQRVLRLDVNMAIFVDPKGKPFIEWMRRGRENRTQIITTSIQEFPYYKMRGRIAEIMNSDEYKQDNELVAKQLCESYSPEYDILQLSKLYFLDRIVQTNPFKNTYFMWMDSGYGHGQDIHPSDGVWIPKGLFEYANQTTFIDRKPGVAAFANVKHKLHKMSINIMPGFLCAGGSNAITELYEMQKKQFALWMEQGVIDDDQTMNMLLYYQKPSLFHLVPGDWYDFYKLFSTQTTEP